MENTFTPIIGEIIKDIEDGDCYFIGQVTEIKN
jgi:hypothetical protein